jgi:hypothetical protein
LEAKTLHKLNLKSMTPSGKYFASCVYDDGIDLSVFLIFVEKPE